MTSPKPLEDVLKMSWRHFCKMSWRRFEDVLKTSWKRLEDVLKMSWRRFCKASWRCFEDVLASSLEDVLKMYWRHLEDVLKTSSTCIEDIWLRQVYSSWSRRLEDVFWSRRRKTSSRRLHQDECLLGNISRKKWMMSFNFGMKINIKVFYMLILSFWVCITRNAQSTQIKFACLCSIFRKAWAMKLIFYLQINTYTSPSYQKQKVCYFSAIS